MTKSPKKNVEQSQSPSHPEGWHTVRYGDVAKKIRNIVDRRNCDLDRFVAGEHMRTDDFRIDEWGTIDDGYLGPAFDHKFSKGQILYGSRRTYLRKVSIPQFDGVCANTTFVIEPTGDDLVPELLPFVMQSAGFNDHSIRKSKGSTNPYISWNDIACYEFAIPDKEQQRRIATTLWAAEDCIMKGERFLVTMERAKQVLMGVLFSKGMNFFDPTKTKLLIENAIPLGEICEFKNGINFTKAEKGNSGILTVDVKNMYSLGVHVNYDNLYRVNKKIDERYHLKEKDLLIVRSSLKVEGVGWVALAEKLTEPTTFCGFIIRLRVKSHEVDPVFLTYYLRSESGRANLISSSGKNLITNISQEMLSPITIPLPPLPEQRQIAGILTRCDETIAAARANVGVAKALKMKMINEMLGAEGK